MCRALLGGGKSRGNKEVSYLLYRVITGKIEHQISTVNNREDIKAILTNLTKVVVLHDGE